MSQKQGGKGKTSSPSRKASHLRGPARTAANKALKIARHARKMGLNHAQMLRATGTREFPRRREPLPAPRMVLGSGTFKQALHPLHLISCNGVILEITPRLQDADTAKKAIFPKLGFRHEMLHADGRRTLVEKRNAN